MGETCQQKTKKTPVPGTGVVLLAFRLLLEVYSREHQMSSRVCHKRFKKETSLIRLFIHDIEMKIPFADIFIR